MSSTTISTATDSEVTPLLSSEVVKQHDLIYDRFSQQKKRVLVSLVSWCAFIPYNSLTVIVFASGSFIPSISEIARDLNTTPIVVSFAIGLSIFAGCIGALTGATYSTYYGRRPTYLTSLPLLCMGSFGVALSQTVPELMAYRFLQALGASPGMAVGAGVIGDIYKLEERGTAMGIFFAASCLGPAIAPPIGGFVAQYYSWRMLQLGLGVASILALILMITLFPETSHPGGRGIDSAPTGSSKLVFINPLRPLLLLKSPNLMSVSFLGFTILSTNYVLLVPLAFTIGKRYGITDPAIVGLCFLPSGIGNMIGAPLAGRLSDRVIVKWRAKRGGVWYPEDRLRASYLASATLVPLSLLFSGLITTFVPGRVGLVLNIICVFVNGLGIDMALSPCATYVVDTLHNRSAEAMAAYHALRNLLLSMSTAAVLPMVEVIGVAWTDAISALLAALGCILLLLTIRYGGKWRSGVDIGYATQRRTKASRGGAN